MSVMVRKKAAVLAHSAGVWVAVGSLSDIIFRCPLEVLWDLVSREAWCSPQSCAECIGLFEEEPGDAKEEGGE